MTKRIFFDVGANDGNTSVPWAHHKDVLVYAFEPTPEMIVEIESKTLGMDNYILTKKAVSDFNGSATFNVSGKGGWGCSSLLEFSEKSKTAWPGRTDFNVTNKITVDVIRLDSFIEEHHISEIEFLHVDTQGSDLKVLHGMGQYLQIVQSGVIEAANKSNILYVGQNSKEECVTFLEENGFVITNIESNDLFGNEVNIYFTRKIMVE